MKVFLAHVIAALVLASPAPTPERAATIDEPAEAVRWLLEARGMIRSGRHFEGMEKLQATVKLADQTGEKLTAALAQVNMAEVYRFYGNAEKAAGLYREALERYRALGHRGAVEAMQERIEELAGPPAQESSETDVEPDRENLIGRAIERIRNRLRPQQKDRGRTPAEEYAAYLDNVKTAVVGAWSYPKIAIRNFKEGRVEVVFAILADGALESVRVVQTSGHSSMDLAAVDAVRTAAPFPKIPELLGVTRLEIDFIFNYALK
jgi:TonB family protein